MQLRFLGKQSAGGDSPTLYATDRDSYVVQGWKVDDTDVLARLDISAEETCVEIPPRLLEHLAKDGLTGRVANLIPPIVGVTSKGSYIVHGRQVLDDEALGQMAMPDHESCVEVPSTAMKLLLGEGDGGSDHERGAK